MLRDVTNVSCSTNILGYLSSMPIYIVRRVSLPRDGFQVSFKSAAALGKLGHPDGELNLTRAAGNYDIIQMVRKTPVPNGESALI